MALASKSQTWRPCSMCCSQPAMCVELSWVRNSPTSIHTLCSATPQDHGVRSCSQAVVSGATVWLWGLVQDWTRVPRQQRDTLLGSLWPWECAGPGDVQSSANMSELWPPPPSTEKSHLQGVWGGSSQQKKTELRMLGEEDLMVPCELLDPAHPQAGNLWHLNYVRRQSTVPVLPKQAVLRFSLLVETPIYSGGNTDLLSFFCHPVFRGR